MRSLYLLLPAVLWAQSCDVYEDPGPSAFEVVQDARGATTLQVMDHDLAKFVAWAAANRDWLLAQGTVGVQFGQMIESLMRARGVRADAFIKEIAATEARIMVKESFLQHARLLRRQHALDGFRRKTEAAHKIAKEFQVDHQFTRPRVVALLSWFNHVATDENHAELFKVVADELEALLGDDVIKDGVVAPIEAEGFRVVPSNQPSTSFVVDWPTDEPLAYYTGYTGTFGHIDPKEGELKTKRSEWRMEIIPEWGGKLMPVTAVVHVAEFDDHDLAVATPRDRESKREVASAARRGLLVATGEISQREKRSSAKGKAPSTLSLRINPAVSAKFRELRHRRLVVTLTGGHVDPQYPDELQKVYIQRIRFFARDITGANGWATYSKALSYPSKLTWQYHREPDFPVPVRFPGGSIRMYAGHLFANELSPAPNTVGYELIQAAFAKLTLHWKAGMQAVQDDIDRARTVLHKEDSDTLGARAAAAGS